MNAVPDRAALIAASAASIVSLAPVALYQLGAVRHLPDPPFRLFDSDAITSSRMAHPFGVPDSLLGIASYGVTLALALAPAERSMLRRALAAKIALDGCLAGANTVRQMVSFRRICFWCMGTVLTSAAIVWSGRKLLRSEIES